MYYITDDGTSTLDVLVNYITSRLLQPNSLSGNLMHVSDADSTGDLRGPLDVANLGVCLGLSQAEVTT